nr:MAG TPA: Helix-turn-helix XRE-family like protein [Caudoviricetes sp.]
MSVLIFAMNIFLENLKKELHNKKLTQKELAEKTGISVNTIRGWFSKDLTPDVFSAVKIASVLDTTAEFLATGKNSDTNDSAKKELSALKAKLLELATS